MLSNPDKQKTNAVVVPVPVTPVVLNDSVTTKRNAPITITVLANDIDYNPATVTIVEQPTQGGVAVANADGTITFTPSNNYTGDTSFKYAVRSPAPHNLLSNAAVVGVKVTAPATPIVVSHAIYVPHNTTVDIYVLAGASDADNDIVATTASLVVSNPSHGTVVKSGSGLNGLKATYTPTSGYSGLDSFTYTINDSEGQVSNTATVTLQVAPAVLEGGEPAWVNDTIPWEQFTVRLGLVLIPGKRNPLEGWTIGGTDWWYEVLPPEPGDAPFPMGSVGDGWGAADKPNYPYGTPRQVAVGQRFNSITDVLSKICHNDYFDQGGITVHLPPGMQIWVGTSSGDGRDTVERWGVRCRVRFVGHQETGLPHPWHSYYNKGARSPSNTTMLLVADSQSTGIDWWPTSGSRVRFENIMFTARNTPQQIASGSARLFRVMDAATNWQFVNCTCGQFGEIFKGDSWKEEVSRGTTGFVQDYRKSYEHGVYDKTYTFFGVRQIGLWFYNTVFCGNGGSVSKDWHTFYSLDGQHVFERCLFFDTPFKHNSENWRERGHHMVKLYGTSFFNGCVFVNKFGNDVDATFQDNFSGTIDWMDAAWGQNLDIGADCPWVFFTDCQFYYRERQESSGEVNNPGGSTKAAYLQVGVRGQDHYSITSPHPWALPDHYYQYTLGRVVPLDGQPQGYSSFCWGYWENSTITSRGAPTVTPGTANYGFGTNLIGNADIMPGVSSYTLPAATTHPGVNLALVVGAPYTLSFTTESISSPGTYGVHTETTTYDGTKFVCAPGGGPPQGWKIRKGSWFRVHDGTRADNPRRRAYNPKYYDKNDPDYVWPKVAGASFNPNNPTNKDWLKYRSNKVFTNCRAHYIGTNASGGAPVFMKAMNILPYSIAVSDLKILVGPLPPQYDGVGTKPSGAGVYSGNPAEVCQPGFFGGSAPSGGGGFKGSDYVDPQNIMFINFTYSVENSGIGNSTLPVRPSNSPLGRDFTLLDDYTGDKTLLTPENPPFNTYRFNSAGDIVSTSDASQWPTQVSTTLAADVPVGATQITVASSANIAVGYRVWLFLTNDYWSITPFFQQRSKNRGVEKKVAVVSWYTTVDAINGNTITLHDPVPSLATYMQSPIGAWADTVVTFQQVFPHPNGLITRFEEHPYSKLVWRKDDFD